MAASAIVPWNSCGAYMSVAPGIATIAYLPYCFFNLLDVAVTSLLGIIGFRIAHIAPEEEIQVLPEEADFRGVGGHEFLRPDRSQE